MRPLLILCFSLTAMMIDFSNAVKSSDIEQFWMDDYKAFENLYSRTSDKDLYRRSVLPAVYNHPVQEIAANHKTHGNVQTETKQYGDLFDDDESPYADRYIRLLAEQTLKSFDKTKPKPGTKYFTNSYFKPITKKNNADLYNYLEKLESYAQRKKGGSKTSKTSKSKHEKVSSGNKAKHALVYSAATPVRVRCGKLGCNAGKRPSKITRINGPYLKRVKHKIIRF